MAKGCRATPEADRISATLRAAYAGILASSLGRSATTAFMRSTRRSSKPNVCAVKTVVQTLPSQAQLWGRL
jgi:hypothetical protein